MFDSDYQKRVDEIAKRLEKLRPTVNRTASGITVDRYFIPIASYTVNTGKAVR